MTAPAPGYRLSSVEPGLRWLLAVGPAALLLLLALVVVYKAWVSDDAYITFRTVLNVLDGRGPVWNPDERVQVFTHPAWMLIMSLAASVSGDVYYTCLALGSGLTLISAAIVGFGLAQSSALACLGLAVLITSRAFTDYATSGLENPLSHALLMLLMLRDRPDPGTRTLAGFSALASLCLLTRPDLLLLLGPAWIALFVRTRGGSGRRALALLLGTLPLLVWHAFSLLYYGDLVLSNSARAKLWTGLPASALAWQGCLYLLNSLRWDPITLVAIGTGVGWVALLARRARPAGERSAAPASPQVWALGVGLGLVYLVAIGGDFMSGRFLTPALVVSVGLLVSRPVDSRLPALVALLLLAQLLVPWTSPFRERSYGRAWHAAIDAHGIADERSFYLGRSDLRSGLREDQVWPDPTLWNEARQLRHRWREDPAVRNQRGFGVLSRAEPWPPPEPPDSGRPARPVVLRGAVGFLGFHLEGDAHVLDYHAIGDPLLSRLPMTMPDPFLPLLLPGRAARGWRVGHYYRRPPLGYPTTLATGANAIADPDLAAYYEVLIRITRDPVLDPERLRALLRFQLGLYDHLLEPAWAADSSDRS